MHSKSCIIGGPSALLLSSRCSRPSFSRSLSLSLSLPFSLFFALFFSLLHQHVFAVFVASCSEQINIHFCTIYHQHHTQQP